MEEEGDVSVPASKVQSCLLPISLLMSQLSQGSDPSQMATKELRAGILIGVWRVQEGAVCLVFCGRCQTHVHFRKSSLSQ